MDRLPGDLVQHILRKLAVQDPQSLLEASRVSTSLHEAVENHTALWKQAFLAAAGSTEESLVHLNAIASAALDTEVGSLGGYKRLALLKLRDAHTSKSLLRDSSRPRSEQTHSATCRAGSEEGSSKDGVNHVARYLLLCTFRGMLIGWRADSPNQTSPLARSAFILPTGKPGDPVSISIETAREPSSDPRSTFNEIGVTYNDIVKTWVSIADHTTSGGAPVVEEKLFVVTHAFLGDVISRPGLVTSRSGKLWKWTFTCSNVKRRRLRPSAMRGESLPRIPSPSGGKPGDWIHEITTLADVSILV